MRSVRTRPCTTCISGGTAVSDAPLLSVNGMSAFYGTAQALEDVSFEIAGGATSIIGRNGMGKTTLCNAIVGVPPARVTGSIRFQGKELVGLPSYKIAKLGIAYVPQGRRLFPSLSVDEHLRMLGRRGSSKRWTVDRAYELFPRLQERKRNGGAQLSGGEQQMLAIARALLTNPQLLIMDEPTEGLAPVIVAQVEEMLVRLGEDGEMSVLVIEQNIGVATAISKSVAIMVNGRINRIIDSARLAADRELQQRLLGVGVHAVEADFETETARPDAESVP